ncbi:hypothetical protein [Cohnella boryungensis]|uniref:Uncharacterized protein n=1 Tax=Cohnella boryungensis TaxID=768479 RepID=A0ABV8S335_9BACL
MIEKYGQGQKLSFTTNLTKGKAGNILCVVKKDTPNHYALGKALKNMIGIENAFVLFE